MTCQGFDSLVRFNPESLKRDGTFQRKNYLVVFTKTDARSIENLFRLTRSCDHTGLVVRDFQPSSNQHVNFTDTMYDP